MGNCECNNTVIGEPNFQQMPANYQLKQFSQEYKNDYVEVHGNTAVVEESEEGGLVLVSEPTKLNDYIRMKIMCDTAQTSIGIGVVDVNVVQKTDFSGQCNHGLDHGMWIVYSDKQIAASGDPKLDKKQLGIEVSNGDIIECNKNGNIFTIKKSGDNQQMTFNLPENITYHFAVYLYSGWDSTEAKVSEAKIEIL